MTPNPRPGRFSTQTPLEREFRLKIQRKQRRRRRQQETAEQRERRLGIAQRRQRRQQKTGEQRNRRLEYQRHYDRFTCGKPTFISFTGFPADT